MNEAGDAGRSSVQFSAPIYYGDAMEGEMTIDVIRIGYLDSTCTVKYETSDNDGLAEAGDDYVYTSGTLTFNPGEHMKSFPVQFIRNGVWSTTVEFNITLSEPNNCILGGHLYKCRIKVLDDDTFPHNDFADEVQAKDFKAINGLQLYFAYCRWNILSAGLGCATAMTLIFDQLKNLYALAIVNFDMYLVNVVLNPDADDSRLLLPSRPHTGYLIAAIHILPWCFLLAWEYVKTRQDIKGRSALHLQRHMYRKYMNLGEELLEEFEADALEYGLLTEAPKCAEGFEAGLDLVQKMVGVLLNIYFVVSKKPEALPFIGMVMVSIILWGTIRETLKVPGVKKEVTALTHIVKETSQKHNLICEYFIRPQMNETFEEAAMGLREKHVKKAVHEFITESVECIAAPLFMALYMMWAVGSVIDGNLELGTFLGILTIIRTVAKETCSAYNVIRDLTTTMNSLRSVTFFNNQETEMKFNKQTNRVRRTKSAEMLKKMDGEPDVDVLPILCSDMEVCMGGEEFFANINCFVNQGKVVGMHGPNACGKSVLTRILCQTLKPAGGNVFMPSHLRTLVVSSKVLFLDRSLLTNLTIGLPQIDKEDIDRMKAILKELDLEKLIPVLEEELKDREKAEDAEDLWSRTLSYADQIKVGLARAFLTNPEVMILQKPFANLDAPSVEKVKSLLQAHVKDRGLHMVSERVGLRRPRTVIFTSDKSSDTNSADVVWEILPTGKKNPKGHNVWTMKNW